MKKREWKELLEARTQQVYDGHSKIISLFHEMNELKNKVRKLEAELATLHMANPPIPIDESEQKVYNGGTEKVFFTEDPYFSPPLTVKNIEEIVFRMIRDMVGNAGSA